MRRNFNVSNVIQLRSLVHFDLKLLIQFYENEIKEIKYIIGFKNLYTTVLPV